MSTPVDSFPPPTVESPTPPAPESTPSSPDSARPRRHSAGHVVAIVVGALMLLPGFGMLAGGTAAAVAQAVATDDGYYRFTPDRVVTDGVAVITDDAWLDVDDGGPWVLDFLDLDVRLRADLAGGADPDDGVFVGIARTDDVEAYLRGTRYSVVDDIDGREVRYRHLTGDAAVAAPAEVDIWAAAADGPGEQELVWDARGGRWSVVVMRADGAPGLAAEVEVGVRSDAVTPIAITLIVVGGLTVLAGVGLVVFGARGRRPGR